MSVLKPQKNNHFRLKTLAVWLIMLSAIGLLWESYSSLSSLKEHWSIEQAISHSKKGEIIEGFIKSVPAHGEEWHVLYGKAKSEKPVILFNGQKQNFILFEAEGRLTQARFHELIQSSEHWKEVPSGRLWMELLLSILPYLIFLFVLYFLFFRKGKGRFSSITKSKAKLFLPDVKRKTFKDFAGYEEAKEEVSEIVDFLKDPGKYKRIGAKIPKGCLMVGPPGTGKTLLARAIAGEANVPFFNMSGSDFVEMYVGLGAARVRDTFEQARKNAPCIVFIDEIDAVGRNRGDGIGGSNDEREQTLNSLLVEMDGFEENTGIVVIAATNRPDVLDSALLRPGRFDRQVVIDIPDFNGRFEILKVHAKRFKIKKNVSLKEVARHTSGFSGADLENLLNEAGLLAARYNKEEIDRSELDEAYDKVSYGRERRRLMDAKDKQITAFHEAGHAIIQAVIDDGNMPIHKVTILPRGQNLGSTMFIPKKDILNYSKTGVLNNICCSMGGRVSEEIEFNEITSGASGDIQSATKLAKRMVCDWGMSDLGTVYFQEEHGIKKYSELTSQKIDETVAAIISNEYQRAQQILKEKYDLVQKLAAALLKFETIEGRSVYELVKFGEFKSKISFSKRKPSVSKDQKKEKKVTHIPVDSDLPKTKSELQENESGDNTPKI